MPEGDVYQGERLVGHLDRTATGSLLRFLPDVVHSPDSYPGYLAWTIPYRNEPLVQEGDNLHPYFLNLLPEGIRLRMIIENQRVSRDDFLGMLLLVGSDTIGDVSVAPSGEPLPPFQPPLVESHSDAVSFWDLFRSTVGMKGDTAIPGVQEKISSSTVTFGVRKERNAAAILKLNPDRYPRLVQNEAFFLKAARKCGIRTASARLIRDKDGVEALLVDRFDRVATVLGMRKLHQEDACQLLGHSPVNKYSLKLQDVAKVLSAVCTAKMATVLELLRLYAYCYIIGNADLHGKNISVLWQDSAITMAPAYDLLSTAAYSSLESHMALQMDGKDANFRSSDFVRFGERYGLPPKATLDMLTKLASNVQKVIPDLPAIGFEEAITDKLAVLIRQRARFLADAG